jgi:hypothetical protein
MPNQKITADKAPCNPPPQKKITVSMPNDLVAKIDAAAKITGLSREAVIETLLSASTAPASVPGGPHVCPRGYRPPCAHHRPHVPGPGDV